MTLGEIELAVLEGSPCELAGLGETQEHHETVTGSVQIHRYGEVEGRLDAEEVGCFDAVDLGDVGVVSSSACTSGVGSGLPWPCAGRAARAAGRKTC